jgi:hypothetical protein
VLASPFRDLAAWAIMPFACHIGYWAPDWKNLLAVRLGGYNVRGVVLRSWGCATSAVRPDRFRVLVHSSPPSHCYHAIAFRGNIGTASRSQPHTPRLATRPTGLQPPTDRAPALQCRAGPRPVCRPSQTATAHTTAARCRRSLCVAREHQRRRVAGGDSRPSSGSAPLPLRRS